jgi:hypothetical protein
VLRQWEEEEARRLKTPSDEALVAEAALVMNGRNYSWGSIKK